MALLHLFAPPARHARWSSGAAFPGRRITLLGLVPVLCAIAVAGGCRHTSGETGSVSPLASAGEAPAEFDVDAAEIRPKTYLAAGRLAESRGDFALAVRQYRLALEGKPDDPEALFRLGVVMSKQRDPQAVDTWKRYVSVTDGSATGWANLGFCYELLGEHAEAEAAYQKGIERDPKNVSCRVNYGMLLAARGFVEGAAQQMNQVLPPAQSWYNIAAVCATQGKRDEAIAAYVKALEYDPKLNVAQHRLNLLLEQDPATQPVTRPATAPSTGPSGP